MITNILFGSGLAFSAAIQPGPLQAFLFSKVASVGWRRTLPAALAPVLSDGPIAVVMLLVLGQLSVTMQVILRAAGGLLLLYFAYRSFMQWRAGEVVESSATDKLPRTLFEATLVNLLNPNPYIGWGLILGPAVVAAWREAPSEGVALVGAFYATMVVTQGLLIYIFGATRWLSPKIRRGLLLVSAVILAGFGVYQLVVAGGGLVGG
ncbi:MAG: LysE family transporter [bacterium]|nr:LysE family transporter [bacterium]